MEREPENPFVAVFAPLVIDDDAELRRLAPSLWQRIRQAPIDEQARAALSQVLEFWFFERFRGLSAQEIWAMLNLATPIQETRAYQSIFAEGKAEGKAEDLSRLLTRRFGTLPSWAIERIQAASIAELNRARNPMLTEYIQAALARRLRFLGLLERDLGQREIDVVIESPDDRRPIVPVAQKTGIAL